MKKYLEWAQKTEQKFTPPDMKDVITRFVGPFNSRFQVRSGNDRDSWSGVGELKDFRIEVFPGGVYRIWQGGRIVADGEGARALQSDIDSEIAPVINPEF